MDGLVAPIHIGQRAVGPGHPCFIITEAGVNHNGSLEMARRLVEAAVQAGADAVKFQTFDAGRLVTAQAPKAEYQKETTDATESQYDMLRKLELSPEMHRDLMGLCKERGILFMSSPFDEESADLLEELGVAVYKVPSGEITNLPYLTHVAAKGKPMVVSTGMSYLKEVEAAVDAIMDAGDPGIALLHCVSNYPAAPQDANLTAMGTMVEAFGVPVGYSDHTPGIEVSLAAVALGACVIEKHLTMDRNLPGPDHLASLEPPEFSALVRGIRVVEAALGDGRKEPASSEAGTAAVARKSLVAARDIPAGTTLSQELIAVKRPGTGLPPARRQDLIGRVARVDIEAGELIAMEMLS